MPTFPTPDISELTPFVGEGHWIETLQDGSHVLIRPLQPDDRDREIDFIERLSPEARHFRFLGTIKEVSPELLDRLMEVDYRNSLALVALAHQNGELVEVGVSRYAASGEKDRCECAVTVADAWQHRGLAVALMRHLIDAARKNGFKQMYSIDSAANRPLQDLASYLGFERQRDPDDTTQVIHTLQL